MINERALVAAMKNDYKGKGYKAAVGTEGVTICGHGWGVQTEMERVMIRPSSTAVRQSKKKSPGRVEPSGAGESQSQESSCLHYSRLEE